MFFVINKEKLSSYIVLITTVLVLFVMASKVTPKVNTIETSADVQKKLPIYNVETNENKIAYTINCAWNADDIDLILDILEKNNIKITFFLVGNWVDKYPDAAKKIAESGNEIGVHSNTHPHVNNLTYEKNIEEIEKCSNKIEEITGKKTYLYRTPYGEYNDTVISAAQEKGYIPIQWNIDTLDYNSLTGEEMWKRINEKIARGSIILSHNGTEHTADSLDKIIKNIKLKGYEIVPVSDLIYKNNYLINSNGTQIMRNE
ncbi:MAG: polysaccharide deacetylase family protein [Clostridia bacterium]|nr:polysaccharide deacetylase family protein [Clostridia bacterium]